MSKLTHMPLTESAQALVSEPPSPQVIGDWLLTFGPQTASIPARYAANPWTAAIQGEGWTLWQTAAGAGWRGMPLVVVEDDSWLAWLVGELYGTDSPSQTIREVLDGNRGPDTLSGHFLLLARDRSSDEWHVWTNRHATLHGYVAGDEFQTRAIGTFCPAVAAAGGCIDLDWEGLSTFFGFGYFGGDRTHFDGVRILRPATHYRLAGDGRVLEETRYWQWQHTPDHSRTYDETVDEFARLFETVMGELTSADRVAVPISGGLDSRSTVATLPADQAHDRLWAYSYGYGNDSMETAIARQVAGARGLTFDAFTIGPYLFAQLPQISAAVEGFEDVTQCRQAAVVNEIDDHADYLIGAHLGDLYLADMGLVGVDELSDEELTAVVLKKVHKGGSDWLLEHLCRPHLKEVAPEDIFHENVSAELDRLDTIAEPDFRVKAYKVDQWCARWTTVAFRMYQAAAFPRLPFYDNRLEDFFCTVPTEMVSGRRLQIDYLRRYAPDLARITWQATGHDLYHDGKGGLMDLATRVMARGARTLRGQKPIERNWEIQFTGKEGRQALAEWLLRPGLLLHNYLDSQAIRDLLAAFAADPYEDKRSYTVAMLLSFSAWLELQYRAVIGEQ